MFIEFAEISEHLPGLFGEYGRWEKVRIDGKPIGGASKSEVANSIIGCTDFELNSLGERLGGKSHASSFFL